ncbi:MAG TPA: chemotaxis protein CheW [Terriglobia bacterium]|nr:chemotaxis protein CheW [Terriglobia bacterium]
MLLLTFQAGGQPYGIEARNVIQVAPYPACTPLPHAPPYIAGLATWHGQTLPVIDLSALLGGTAARPLLSARLLIVDHPCSNGGSQPLGLLVEKAVETIRQDEIRCEPQKVTIPEAPYLNGTAEHDGRLIQRLAFEELLPPSVRQLLFPYLEAA